MEALRIKRGNPFLSAVTITKPDGNPLNLTFTVVLFTVRSLNDKADDDGKALITQEMTDHYEPENGRTYISLSSIQTAIPEGTYVGDIRVIGIGLQQNSDPFLVEIEPIITTRLS